MCDGVYEVSREQVKVEILGNERGGHESVS